MALTELYVLKCPINKEVRYVGKANNSAKRFKGHLYYADKRKTPLYDWILALRSKGLIPELEVVKTISVEFWEVEEIKLISEYRNKGARLLNVAEGGNQPYCSKEVRSANGRKVADIRDKRMWKLKHAMGQSLKWLRNNGREEKAKQLTTKLNLAGFNF